ncbi:MAG: CDP-alcohol phosphatidyltransferase family protein [Bacteroidales bacterium]|nr:CDP-alcohol phosphatidyltransferase family protein [Bacteroidales bacterium]
MKKHIPNTLTICNLLCGVFSVVISTTQFKSLELAVALIFCGAVFDFFDGFSARLLKVASPIGKELDSLADLITFGFAPAAITSTLIFDSLYGGQLTDYDNISTYALALTFFPYIIVAFSALRLAKFNLDTRQAHSFIGLPTPANAIFFASFAFLPDIDLEIFPIILDALCLVFSLLLVSEIPMFSLKFQNYSWADNKIRFSFLICTVILLAIFKLQALTGIMVLYIVLSLVDDFVNKKTPDNLE